MKSRGPVKYIHRFATVIYFMICAAIIVILCLAAAIFENLQNLIWRIITRIVKNAD